MKGFVRSVYSLASVASILAVAVLFNVYFIDQSSSVSEQFVKTEQVFQPGVELDTYPLTSSVATSSRELARHFSKVFLQFYWLQKKQLKAYVAALKNSERELLNSNNNQSHLIDFHRGATREPSLI